MSEFAKGSEWRRWELHIHTPDTLKNDQFKGVNSEDKWENYYSSICNYIKEETEKNIAAIAITDYLSIDNYIKVKKDNKLPSTVKLILPNVELRILPVTGKERPINIHCIFSPDLDKELENRFFGKLKFSYGSTSYSASKTELIRFGKAYSSDSTLNNQQAIKKAREQFIIPIASLNELFKEDRELREKTIIIVANGSSDGASGISEKSQAGYLIGDEKSHSQLAATRQEIYKMVDAIFSSSPTDIKYFLGKSSDDIKTIQRKYGALMPCFHGSDAHTNSKIFNPDNKQFCWIKADLTFKGLKHAINDPSDRVFIGEKPDILRKITSNKTKYIKNICIDTIQGKDDATEQWFKSVQIPLNNELVAIIGNKGSGKSAIADIIGLCADSENHTDFLFLHPHKFKNNKGLANRFFATLEFESGTKTEERILDHSIENSRQKVRYLPQSYFEKVCNNIQDTKSFREEIEKVVFQYTLDDETLKKENFQELVFCKEKIVNQEIRNLANKISDINKIIIALEDKKTPQYKNSLISKKTIKQNELDVHLENKPEEKENPQIKEQTSEAIERQTKLDKFQTDYNNYSIEISQLHEKTGEITLDIHTLESLKREIDNKKLEFDSFIFAKKNQLIDFGFNIDSIIKVTFNLSLIDTLIQSKQTEISSLKTDLTTTKSNSDSCTLEINKIKQSLTTEQREYQDYLENLEIWKNKKLALEGNENMPDTLAFFNKEISYIDDTLVQEIKTKRKERLSLTKQIYAKKSEIKVFYDEIKSEIDKQLLNFAIQHFEITSSFSCDSDFNNKFLNHIHKGKVGSFSGTDESKILLNLKIKLTDWNDEASVEKFLIDIIDCLECDKREGNGKATFINELVKDRQEFYDYLFSLNYLKPHYQLQQNGKSLEQLSPGEKGALLLIFYLVLDKEDIPLIIDQPEDNLDNHSVATVLVPYIREAKKRRQIIMVTHNPNLAVVADAEQVIRVYIDKENGNKFSFISGGIENPVINEAIVDVLEGTMPAFSSRRAKYHAELSVKFEVDISN